MYISARWVFLPLLLVVGACDRRPTRAEALQALRASNPTYETATVYERVWQDGPPWFSCAEVLAKIGGNADREVVRDAVGNWRSLIMAGWIVVKDTMHAPVADPGWCTVKLTSEGLTRATSWPAALGSPTPDGSLRRGWLVPVGVRRVEIVGVPTLAGADSASAGYQVTIIPNENGVGTGAARDTLRYVADLRRVKGQWRATAIRAGRASD